jgi:hypothetical protein
MKDRHFTGDASLDASASLPFQHHNNGYGEAARSHGGSHLIHECSGRSSSVPPPTIRTRPDDIRSIDEKHCSSLTFSAGRGQREVVSPTPARRSGTRQDARNGVVRGEAAIGKG